MMMHRPGGFVEEIALKLCISLNAKITYWHDQEINEIRALTGERQPTTCVARKHL